MRNLFDQYETPENRLTHALASCLAEDRRLLRQFVRWSTGKMPSGSAQVEIIEQQLPGDPEVAEEVAERQGLPDMCIHDRDTWCLAVESKVMSSLSADQLRRHEGTIRRRGFSDVNLLAITTGGKVPRIADGVYHKSWTDVYKWSRQHQAVSPWAGRLAEYLEVAEMRMAASGYLTEGALTEFSGVPFSPEHPYNYPEAKRALVLLMRELRKRRDLERELGADLSAKGRPAITGKVGSYVWDVLRLDRDPSDNFVKAPHLTVSLRHEEIWAMLCLSNAMKGRYRSRVKAIGSEGFMGMIRSVALRMEESLAKVAGFQPRVEVLQRRYPTQRSQAVVDGRVEADLRTLLDPAERGQAAIRKQPVWAATAHDIFVQRRGNVQLGIGVAFPYARCPATQSSALVDYVAAAWIACKPPVDLVFGRTR